MNLEKPFQIILTDKLSDIYIVLKSLLIKSFIYLQKPFFCRRWLEPI